MLWDVFLKISMGKSLNHYTMKDNKKELTAEEFWYSQPPMKNIPDAIREYYELKTMKDNKKELTAEEFWYSQPPMKNIPDAIREYYELKTMDINERVNKTINELLDMADFKNFWKEQKSGMYGEMPKIKIGKYTISEMSNEENCTTIWIEDAKTGEGGQFSKETFMETLEKYYLSHF